MIILISSQMIGLYCNLNQQTYNSVPSEHDFHPVYFFVPAVTGSAT